MERNKSYDIGNPFRNTGTGPQFENEDLQQMLEAQYPDCNGCFFAGIYIGIRADLAEEIKWSSYQQYVFLCASIHQEIAGLFQEQQIGFEIFRGIDNSRFLGVFPLEKEHDFVDCYLRPILKTAEELFGLPLCIGVGLLTEDTSQLKNTYTSSQYAFELYYFEQNQIIEFQNIHRDFTVAPESYYDLLEEIFRAILSKDEHVLDKIVSGVEMIGAIHYGNWRAVAMRTMDYTGVLVSRLYRYHLLDGDFFRMQDELQEKVFHEMTFEGLKRCIREHFAELLPEVYHTDRLTGKAIVEKVKLYMQENYMENLSIKELSDIACVSTNYFSHMFKRETGKNYKAYLTELRMQKAQELLLETDFMIYEISEMVGYNNTRTFTDAFKQTYEISPADFRRKYRK
ncbi:MAG: AraC family transcriptional regulator [Clostridiales bacterium]|nr:AraC family transcriptional regulator [Clostridiales bacterium]